MPTTTKPVVTKEGKSLEKVKNEEVDELVFEEDDESSAFPATTIAVSSKKEKIGSGVLSLESAGSSDDASLHFSDVDSDHDGGSAAPPVWGPAGTPDSSHAASGLFAVSDPGFLGVDKGMEMTSWCSRSQEAASSQPQLLNPALESNGHVKQLQESVRSTSTGTGTGIQSPRTGLDNVSTPTNLEMPSGFQPLSFQSQNTHNVPYNPSGGSSPPLPAVNIFHIQQQQQQHNRSHHYDPNHSNIQQIAYPYNNNTTTSHINSAPQMYIPATQSPATISHMPPTATSHSQRSPGTSQLGDNLNASTHVLSNSANSLGTSAKVGEWSTNVNSDLRGGRPASYDRNAEVNSTTLPSMMYPNVSLYNNAASSFIANSSQNNQRVQSTNRGEWSFSKRSDLGNNAPGNMLLSPNGDCSQSHVSGFAVHGSDAHFTTHQSFNTGSAVVGGYGSTFLPTGGGVHIGGATTPDVTAPLPQFGAVMSHPYSTYPTSPHSAQTATIYPQASRNYGGSPPGNNNYQQQQQQQHPTSYTYSRDRPVSVENWAAMSTPSHSNSVSLKRDSYPHNGGPMTPHSARSGHSSHQSGESASPSNGPLTASRPPKVDMSTENGSSPAAESGSTAVGEADKSVSKEEQPPAAPTTAEVVKVCRHYLEGKCNRRKCRFLHPEGLAGSEAPTQ